MAIDTHTKRRAALSVTVVGLVLPLADSSIAASDRGHASYVYAGNFVDAVPLDLSGRIRIIDQHRYRLEEGHAYRVVEGYALRVVENT